MDNIGQIGEDFVAEWLKQKGYFILAQRWRSPRGEIDLISRNTKVLAFTEVKTRSPKNWDDNGLLAVDYRKQIRLVQGATHFLAKFPKLTELNCRFDVALVRVDPHDDLDKIENNQTFNIKQAVFFQKRKLTLLDYLESAFES